MGQKMNKCKAPGCSKWVLLEDQEGYCSDHACRLDPISALYVDKTPEEQDRDERICEFFAYLLQNRTVEDLL